MTLLRHCTHLAAAIAFAVAVAAQAEQDLAPILAGSPAHGLPGAAPGSERWIVHFQKRSFDLERFRLAIATKLPAAQVVAIVADLERSVEVDQAPFVAAVRALGGTVVRQWWLVNGASVEIAPAQLVALRRLPNVARIQPDLWCSPSIAVATNAANHSADAVQAMGHRGAGVSVAIVDTGQDSDVGGLGRPHRVYYPNGDPLQATGAGLAGSRLLVNRQIGRSPADDAFGHGTGVASIAAGAGWNTPGADVGHAPAAGICGYSIADGFLGYSSYTTMASAWQQVAADRALFQIVAANMSYSGSPSPLSIEQQAIDAVALQADVLCCVGAGNTASSTSTSAAATNGLAVGAVVPNQHTVAPFSSRGPLYGDPQRSYPDIAACGVATAMARRDVEGADYIDSGTSMASPQVCGAAAQLRARFPSLTAVETKAVLLASARDIATQNPGLTRNDFGVGLLRNDQAHQLAAAGSFGSATVTASGPAVVAMLGVRAAHHYQVAIAWHRLDVTSVAWSDLDLEVVDANGAVLAASRSPRNLYELVRFHAAFTGSVTVRVSAPTIAAGATQPFAWAAAETPPLPVQGSATEYGSGCSPLGLELNSPTAGYAALPSPAEFAYEMHAATGMQITGVDVLLARPAGNSGTTMVAIYLPNGAGPAATPARAFGVAVPVTPTMCAVRFPPLAVPPGPFWIAVGHLGTVPLSNVATGTAVAGFERAGLVAGPWVRSAVTPRPVFRIYVEQPVAVGLPRLTVHGTPQIGASVSLELAGALPNTAACLNLGMSDTSAPFGALPYSLGPLGGTGCSVLASGEVLLLMPVDAGGTASSLLAVPPDHTLVSMHLYGQYLVLHPTANALGILTSGGTLLRIGR